DVFVVQYNHALTDNNASAGLLQEIDHLSRAGAGGVAAPAAGRRDLVREYLRRFPRGRRRRAAADTFRLWGRSLRGGVAALSPGPAPAGPVQVRIATRSLGPNATRALQARGGGGGGVPGPPPAGGGGRGRGGR